MGASNNTILVMGCDVGEDKPAFIGDSETMADFLSQARYCPGTTIEERNAMVSVCPVDVVKYRLGLHAKPMFIVAVRDTLVTANRSHYHKVVSTEPLGDW